MATVQQCHTLISYYEKICKQKYGDKPIVNRHTGRWGFDSVLYSMDTKDAKALIDFYFTTESQNKHSLEWFFYNYDKLQVSKRDFDEDAERLAAIREESKKRAEEWRNKLGNQGITSN